MNRLIILILLAPAFANATDPPCYEGCNLAITAGSMVVTTGNDASFNASGTDFTTVGGWSFGGFGGPDGASTITPGYPVSISWGENCDGGFSMSVTVGGFTRSTGDFPTTANPNGRCAFGTFATSDFTISGAGTYTVPFTLQAQLDGDNCVTNCGAIHVNGQGIAALQIVPDTGNPGAFFMPDGIFRFTAPEPPTASLLLLGFAALVVVRWRHRPRMTSGAAT